MENKSQLRVLTAAECKQVAGGKNYGISDIGGISIERINGLNYYRLYLGKRPGKG